MGLDAIPCSQPDAAREEQAAFRASDVFPIRDWLHVRRVDALWSATQMVKVKPRRDGANMHLVKPSVGEMVLPRLCGFVPDDNLRAEGVLGRSLPDPASVFVLDPHRTGKQARAVPRDVSRRVPLGESLRGVVARGYRRFLAASAHAESGWIRWRNVESLRHATIVQEVR